MNIVHVINGAAGFIYRAIKEKLDIKRVPGVCELKNEAFLLGCCLLAEETVCSGRCAL